MDLKRIWENTAFRLLLFAVIACFAVVQGFLLHSAVSAGHLLQRFGYAAMTGTFLWWLISLLLLARREPAFRNRPVLRTLKAHAPALGLGGALFAVAWLAVPYTYKVLYDELVLQSTALNLHYFREFGTIVRAYEINGVFNSLTVYLDKRPFFYPYLVSLAHDLTGYRMQNAFILNTVLLPIVLGLTYAAGRFMGGRSGALVAMAVFGASPLLAQNANGTGMEMLNIAMFLATFALAIYYLKNPGPERLSALVLSCVMLAQTRYESALFVGCVALVILEGWRRSGRVILPFAGLCAPLLLVPTALHNVYLAGTPLLWELRSDMSERFASTYVAGNLKHAFNYFYGTSALVMNAWWLSVVGTLAVGFVIWSACRHRRSWRNAAPEVVVAVMMGLGVMVNFGLLMFYFWGQFDDPIVSRLSLPLYAMMALAVAWTVGRFDAAWRPKAAAWLVAGALLCYLGLGSRATAYNSRINQQATEIAWEEEWLAGRAPMNRLMITNKTSLNWFLQFTSSVVLDVARNRPGQIRFHMDAGTFREVLVSQYYRPIGADGGFVIDPKDVLPAEFELEPLVERQFGGKLLRISRVVKITEAAAPAKLSESPQHPADK